MEGRIAINIRRRELIVALGGAAAAWPLVANAQPLSKLSTVGFIVPEAV